MNPAASGRAKSVAIIGGGFSGAAVAYHLAKATSAQAVGIVVVEPRERIGAGLAYSTLEPAHRINVPAARMSLVSGEPQHFAQWLQTSGRLVDDAQAVTTGGDAFPQRSIFGSYVADMLAPFLASGRVRHDRGRAIDVKRRSRDGGFEVVTDSGRFLADLVVVATTHPLPAVPAALLPLAGHAGFIADPYDPGPIAAIDAEARVLVVGNGLTAADVVATLDRRGHRGDIIALSRHGLRSRGHAPAPVRPFGEFADRPERSALGLLARIRATIEAAALAGLSWHYVIDAVRNQGGAIWTALPLPERRRLVRHLRAFWDVHRFRIAPQVEAALDRRAAAGRFTSLAATLVSARIEGREIEVVIRPRHLRETRTLRFDAVVNTTGPAHRSVVAQDGPIARLHAAGLVRLDAVGLGLDVDTSGQAIDQSGQPVNGLYIGGPLARGTFGELMGLLEVTRYGEFIAAQIAQDLERFASAELAQARRPVVLQV